MLGREINQQELLATLRPFITANTWDASQRIVEEHPELLSDEADGLLVRYIQMAEAQGNQKARAVFEEHRALLRRCREIGVEAAFAEKTGGGGGVSIPAAFREDVRLAKEAEARYQRTSDPADLGEACAAWERIWAHPGFATAEAAFRLAALNDGAGAFLRRYQRLGELGDLERAIGHLEEAVAGTPPGSPDLPGWLNNLGAGLSARYGRTGELADLQRAVRAYQEAVAATPTGSPDLPGWLNNLGTGLSARYGRTGELGDLEGAIRAYEEAVAGMPPGSPNRASILNNLGTGLSDRYGRTGELGDLERAIGHLEEAVAGTPGSPDLPGYLNNLGTGLSARYGRTGETGDLEGAIRAYEKAVARTPPGSPDLPSRLNNLGNAYYLAEDWGRARDAYGQMAVAVEALRAASTLRADREKLVADRAAAYARLVLLCLREGDLGAAFRYAEGAKSRSLMEALGAQRPDMEALAQSDAALGETLAEAQRLRAEVEWLLGQLGEALDDDDNGGRRQALRRSEVQGRIQSDLEAEQALWGRIEREHPAFAVTVSAPPFTLEEAQALAGAEGATLISYYRHDRGWLAFVVNAQGAETVPLPDVDETLPKALSLMATLENPDARTAKTFFYMLRDLYQALVAPLEARLPEPGGRLILAPFGALHLLPLAAARHPETQRYLSEVYRVRVAPSLGTLQAMAQERARHEGEEAPELELLAVAYPGSEDPKDAHYLHHVVQEAKTISAQFGRVQRLLEAEATPERVLAEAGKAGLVHFACHGWFNPAYTEVSGLLLSGGWLTLRRILGSMRLERARLVVLGACLSGRYRVGSGDELTGLITAMVAARARAVIGTLWSVSDAATAALMVAFYRGVQEGLTPDEALAAAQAAVRGQPEWEHPYYWAAFFLCGLAEEAAPLAPPA